MGSIGTGGTMVRGWEENNYGEAHFGRETDVLGWEGKGTSVGSGIWLLVLIGDGFLRRVDALL